MKQRVVEIDITKGIFTLGMVFAHVIQFRFAGEYMLLNKISYYSNLVSFSGFYFCFGYVTWLAYLQKENIPWKSVLKTVLKCYVAFLISGIAHHVLVKGRAVDSILVFNIAGLRDIPGYSEFLISFSLVLLTAVILAPVINFSTRNKRNLIIAIVACLSTTFLPKGIVYDPIVGLFIGGAGVSYYPVIQYMPLFLFGIYIARHKIQYNYLLAGISLVAIVLFIIFQTDKHLISRFPPSAMWIIYSTALVYLYYGIAILIDKHLRVFIKPYLNAVGQNVLNYLILSNLILFTSVAIGMRSNLNSFETVGFYIVILVLLFFIQYINVDLKRTNSSLRSQNKKP